jgi:hypothetical protein
MDMSMNVFKKCIEVAEEMGETISIGGGEPTLHPNFWEIIGITLGAETDPGIPPFIATNGSITEISIKLASMARRGIIYAALSLDSFHDPIDEEVIQAFGHYDMGKKREGDLREIRDVSDHVCEQGRATNNVYDTTKDCACPGLFVDPIGTVFACGCRNYTFGSIWNCEIPDWYNRLEPQCTTYGEIIVEI